MGTEELSATRVRNKKRRQGRKRRIESRTNYEHGGIILKVWDESEGYTDAKWRAECEQRSLNLKVKAMSEVTANKKQYGGDHYLNMGVQVWDVVETWPLEQQIGYFRGGNLKYTMRLGNKDERLQEAKKALHYAEKLVEVLEKHDGNEK